jgi:hypothetical protein
MHKQDLKHLKDDIFSIRLKCLPSQSVNTVSMELNRFLTSSLVKLERFLIDILTDPAKIEKEKYQSLITSY